MSPLQFAHRGETFHWNGELWLCQGEPPGLARQIALSRAYLAEAADPDECRLLRDLARTEPDLVESALDFCNRILRLHPGHRGARALHDSLLSKLVSWN